MPFTVTGVPADAEAQSRFVVIFINAVSGVETQLDAAGEGSDCSALHRSFFDALRTFDSLGVGNSQEQAFLAAIGGRTRQNPMAHSKTISKERLVADIEYMSSNCFCDEFQCRYTTPAAKDKLILNMTLVNSTHSPVHLDTPRPVGDDANGASPVGGDKKRSGSGPDFAQGVGVGASGVPRSASPPR